MSVQSEIDRINGNVASTYSALSEMGATMPETQNSDNLPGTVRTVPQGGGTSVQTDWNQTDETAPDFLKNKPFGGVYSDTLTWDGSYSEDDIAVFFIHISNSVPTVEDVANGLTVHIDGDTVELNGEMAQSCFSEDGFANFHFLFFVVPKDNYVLEMEGEYASFPKAGIYATSPTPLSITITDYNKFVTIDKIDEIYLPDTGYVKQVIVYVGISDNVDRIYKNSELTEMLSYIELCGYINETRRIVVVDENGCYDAIALNSSVEGIIYAVFDSGVATLKTAYCAP